MLAQFSHEIELEGKSDSNYEEKPGWRFWRPLALIFADPQSD